MWHQVAQLFTYLLYAFVFQGGGKVAAVPANNSAQLTLVTDGSETYAIFKYLKYTLPQGNYSVCPNQVSIHNDNMIFNFFWFIRIIMVIDTRLWLDLYDIPAGTMTTYTTNTYTIGRTNTTTNQYKSTV